MPIVVKDFGWKQTEEKVVIQVPLHGIHHSKADIFTSTQYIKISYGAFFFEVVLLHPVDISEIICIKAPNEIIFELKKCVPNTWDSLEITNLTKAEKTKLKTKLIQDEHERLQKEREQKINKKAELKRIAVNEQIELDTRVRSRIENIKKSEETEALGDLNKWKQDIKANYIVNRLAIDNDEHSEKRKNIDLAVELQDETKPPLFKENKVTRKVKNKNNFKDKSDISKAVPKPRSTKSLQILFTPREFPTPCRESRLEEENEFLRKQAEARRSAGFVNEDLRPEEKNPQYLLAKGREFMKNNNYLGAISAFSFGIKLNPKFVDLYLARSEVHLAVGNFKRTVEDCSTALDLLKPALPINLDDRALCTGRRGIALFKLGFLKQGISELEASLKLKKNEEFSEQLEECKLELDEIQKKEEREKEKMHKEINKNDEK